MATSKQYNEREVSLVLKRALDLQKRAGARSEPSSRGLSLDDLTTAGREAGIDPEYIRQAAQSLEGRGVPTSWLGGPLSLEMEGAVEGNLGEDELKDLQLNLGALVGGPGQALVHRGRLVWEAQPNSYSNQSLAWRLTVEPRGPTTRVGLAVDLRVWAYALHGGLIGGLGGGLGVSLGVTLAAVENQPLALTLVPLGLVAGWGLAWALYRWTVHWAQAKGQRILERIVEVVGPGPKA